MTQEVLLSGLNYVYVMNLENPTVRTFGGFGKNGGQFSDPAGVAVDSSGNFVIADAGNHRLQVGLSHPWFQFYFLPLPLPSMLSITPKVCIAKLLMVLNGCAMNDRISASCKNASSVTLRVAAVCYVIHETLSYMLKRRKHFE
jgi:DNA-binding beta-propeller fold protein YncE